MYLYKTEGIYTLWCVLMFFLLYNMFRKMPLQEENLILSLKCSEVLYILQLK